MISKISLGSAQFGLNYGIANKQGKPSLENIRDILNTARKYRIRMVDTASAYGNSEFVLGQIGVNDFKITTKIPSIPDNLNNIESYIENKLETSLINLKVNEFDTVLVHDAKQLANEKCFESIYKVLKRYKNNNLIKKIGISIYGPEELDQIKNIDNFDIIQSPYNIFDRRLKTSGWMKKLKDKGIQIQARSIFLQGLLLMSNSSRPHKFYKWKDMWDRWGRWLENNNILPLNACMNFVFDENLIDSVVVGIDSKDHLDEIYRSIINSSDIFPIDLVSFDESLINPVNWYKLGEND
jgi:aryl-alcohol dehydrogenase-like predicted oxidoreductase